jgi:hypothetical protein
MIRRAVIAALSVVLTVHSVANAAAPEPDTSTATRKQGSPAGAIITIVLIAAAGAGTGGYFFFRKQKRDRAHADSIIGTVERIWDSAAVSYSQERYHDAIKQLQSISGLWYEYEKCSARYRKAPAIHPDSIKAVIVSCDFLERMIQPVKLLGEYADQLPSDEYGLSKIGRHDLDNARQYLRRSMDSIMTAYPNHRTALQYSFRHVERRLQSIDSLISSSYRQQQTDFSAKAKFYYNRAMESGDTAALGRFVDDCDYYQADREWCQRARIVYAERKNTPPVSAVPAPAGKMTLKDSIRQSYTLAVQSKRIETLEAYISKYSARRYRSLSGVTKLDSARAALASLRAVIDRQMAFNRTYPRFGSPGDTGVPIMVKGLSRATETLFADVWNSMKPEIARLPSVRQPAKLTLDHTHEPPTLLLDACIAPSSDVEKNLINSRASYRITGLVPAMKLLRQLKTETLSRLATGTPDAEAIRKATYVIRFTKPENNSMALFYAHDAAISPSDTTRAVEFYEFYDITVPGGESRRLQVYEGSLPNIIPSLSPDQSEATMSEEFFGK